MKKITTMMTTALVCGVMFTSCGGGSTAKSGLKNNEFFGALPALHADFALAKEADKEELDKVLESGNLQRITKTSEKIEKRAQERKEKFDAAVEAEWAKVQGRSIPFSFSQAAQETVLIQNIEITSAKIEGQDVHFHVIAKNDIPRSTFVPDSRRSWVKENNQIFFRLVSKDGSTIYTGKVTIKDQNYTAGQPLLPDFGNTIFVRIFPSSAGLADFTHIEIISEQEHKAQTRS
ncbi:MAG: hypothetical protein FWE63_06310 [Bacteroidales bacterium]|nr:hypothetical protein [Bacteroidales bacterium]